MDEPIGQSGRSGLFCLSCMQSMCELPAHPQYKDHKTSKRRRSKTCKRKVTSRRGKTRLRMFGLCPNCIHCSRCGKTKCPDDFPLTSEVLKRPYKKRVCIDCLHPECTNPSCKTCKVCRDTSCKKKQCNKKPRALLGRAAQYIKLLSGYQYECDACLFPKCACGKEMSATTRYKKRRSPEWLSAMTPRTWSCECCQKTDAAEYITLSQREDPEVQEILNPKPTIMRTVSRRLKRKSSAEKTIYATTTAKYQAKADVKESIIRAVPLRLTRKTKAGHGKQTIKGKRTQEDMMMMTLDSMHARLVSHHCAHGW